MTLAEIYRLKQQAGQAVPAEPVLDDAAEERAGRLAAVGGKAYREAYGSRRPRR